MRANSSSCRPSARAIVRLSKGSITLSSSADNRRSASNLPGQVENLSYDAGAQLFHRLDLLAPALARLFDGLHLIDMIVGQRRIRAKLIDALVARLAVEIILHRPEPGVAALVGQSFEPYFLAQFLAF